MDLDDPGLVLEWPGAWATRSYPALMTDIAGSDDFGFGPARAPEDVLTRLESLRSHDVRWREGRVFSLAYMADERIDALSAEAYRRFAGENALNPGAFPSLRRMQNDVVQVVSQWVNGDDDCAGFMTSGGTESLVLVVRAAKQRAIREGRGHGPFNMVLPTSAHAALEKGADYFAVESRRVEVGPGWRADASAMRSAVDGNTILLVGSAPQYPQGVIDPIGDLAAIAAEAGINMHVDACMGGVVLPYLERSGVEVEPWDFRVPGVTSISVDLHKYGYSAKGAGVLLHRSKLLRNDQTFMTDNWLGGTYGSPGILGTKSGGPIASAWAVMHLLGDAGYAELAVVARGLAVRLHAHVAAHPLLVPVAAPDSTLVAFGSDELDVFALADELGKRGWYVDRQGPPRSIHMTVHAGHTSTLDDFLSDLDDACDHVSVASRGGASAGTTGTYAPMD